MNYCARALAFVFLIATCSCQTARNYDSPLGPRYAGVATATSDAAEMTRTSDIRIVTFNIKFGMEVERAIELLQSAAQLRHADIVTLQEVDADGTARIARSLHMSFVYYPATVHPTTGRDFGNAVLSRWPIVDDQKIVLPHLGRIRGTQRAATAATVVVRGDSLRIYSVHLATQVETGPGSRREQARTLLADAARFDRVIAGGDINSRGMGAVFRACGFLWPTADNGPTLIFFNWDHIFLKGLTVKDNVSTGVVADQRGASDHHPVWVVSVVTPAADPGASLCASAK